VSSTRPVHDCAGTQHRTWQNGTQHTSSLVDAAYILVAIVNYSRELTMLPVSYLDVLSALYIVYLGLSNCGLSIILIERIIECDY